MPFLVESWSPPKITLLQLSSSILSAPPQEDFDENKQPWNILKHAETRALGKSCHCRPASSSSWSRRSACWRQNGGQERLKREDMHPSLSTSNISEKAASAWLARCHSLWPALQRAPAAPDLWRSPHEPWSRHTPPTLKFLLELTSEHFPIFPQQSLITKYEHSQLVTKRRVSKSPWHLFAHLSDSQREMPSACPKCPYVCMLSMRSWRTACKAARLPSFRTQSPPRQFWMAWFQLQGEVIDAPYAGVGEE